MNEVLAQSLPQVIDALTVLLVTALSALTAYTTQAIRKWGKTNDTERLSTITARATQKLSSCASNAIVALAPEIKAAAADGHIDVFEVEKLKSALLRRVELSLSDDEIQALGNVHDVLRDEAESAIRYELEILTARARATK